MKQEGGLTPPWTSLRRRLLPLPRCRRSRQEVHQQLPKDISRKKKNLRDWKLRRIVRHCDNMMMTQILQSCGVGDWALRRTVRRCESMLMTQMMRLSYDVGAFAYCCPASNPTHCFVPSPSEI